MDRFSISDLDLYRKTRKEHAKTIADLEDLKNSTRYSDKTKKLVSETLVEQISSMSEYLRSFMKMNLTNVGSINAMIVPIYFENSHTDLIDLEKVKKCEFIMLENGEVIQLTQNLMHKITLMSKEYGSKKYFFQGTESKKDLEPVYAYYIDYTDTEPI